MDYSVYGYSLVPLIMLLVSVIRMIGLPKRYLPIASIGLGIVAGLLYLYPDEPKRAVLEGIVLGLVSVGVWSGVKNTFERTLPPD